MKEEAEKQLMNEKHSSDKEMLQLEHENSLREMVEIQVRGGARRVGSVDDCIKIFIN